MRLVAKDRVVVIVAVACGEQPRAGQQNTYQGGAKESSTHKDTVARARAMTRNARAARRFAFVAKAVR